MTRRRLFQYIEQLESTDDYVLSDLQPDPLIASWVDAESDAVAAYEMRALDRDPASYAIYRAYADQADAAQDALAATTGRLIA